ncbi:Transcription factor AP-4 [Atta colombica]|uniref:Transcription factor AP-4 n=1 Tax=Atta colombica TaxID=520822 RepID=A0A195BG06_9HYME|nr:Transcription factor AP-4 [Atta colombica]
MVVCTLDAFTALSASNGNRVSHKRPRAVCERIILPPQTSRPVSSFDCLRKLLETSNIHDAGEAAYLAYGAWTQRIPFQEGDSKTTTCNLRAFLSFPRSTDLTSLPRYLSITSSPSSPLPSPLANGLGLRRVLQSDSANKNSARALELGLNIIRAFTIAAYTGHLFVNHLSAGANRTPGPVTPRSWYQSALLFLLDCSSKSFPFYYDVVRTTRDSLHRMLSAYTAAILQQTAEYIYQLEQEKTQLLSQNCQLKRLVNQHEGGDVPIKKRKPDTQDCLMKLISVVVSLPMHVSESGDEGLGSMSPEPLSVITVTTEGHSVVNSDVVELKRQLDRERQARLHLEKQMRAIQSQVYPERFRDNQLIAYQPHEVIEHTDNVMAQETEEAVATLQVVSVMSLPPVGSTQTVETSSPDPSSPPLSPQPAEMVSEEIKEEESRASTPKIVAFAQNQVFTAMEEPTTADSFSSSSRVTYATSSSADFKTGSPQYITASPSRPFSPVTEPRLPSVLEAAMKAEPKVEVERLPSPSSSLDDGTSQARLYIANTSRQNLETIVEAIRHLEGDHLFSDEPAQDVPLALTNKQQQQQQQQATANSTSTKSATTSASSSSPSTTSATATSAKQRILHADRFLQFHTQQQTQQRPGVIVVKHS